VIPASANRDRTQVEHAVVASQARLSNDLPVYKYGNHSLRRLMAFRNVARRACIQQGGKPGDCSDDANLHP
jgi:hypothetical protein